VEGQRFLYLPSAGYALAFAAALDSWLWRHQRVMAGLLCALLLAAGVKSTFRAHLVEEAMAPIVGLAELREQFRGGDQLYFIDLPPLVCMGFGAAVRHILGREDLRVTALTLSPELPPSAARWVAGSDPSGGASRGRAAAGTGHAGESLEADSGGAEVGWPTPISRHLSLTRSADDRLLVERIDGEYFATYMERFFLWGQALPREGSLIHAHQLEVEIGARGVQGGIRSLRFSFANGLNSPRNWFFLCMPGALQRLRPAELPLEGGS
jgi:hypothetical protein